MINFKKFLEMASFTLPQNIKIKNQDYVAVDMMFEKNPRTVNRNGKIMNQGSKFIAKIPNSKKYLAYDGQGEAKIIPNEEAKILEIEKEYEKIPNNWWKKARFINEF